MAYHKSSVVGGSGGSLFEDLIVPKGSKLREIRLLSSQYVNAIQLIFIDKNGSIGEMRPVGGLNGELNIFTLDSDEYLIGVSGRNGWYLDSIRFHTNKRVSDLFGGDGGYESFEFSAKEGSEIVGFHGKADWYIDQLGVVSRELAKTPAKKAAKKAAPKAKATPKRKSKKKADLTIVEGIGPKLAEVLTNAGIPDLADLAKAEISNLKKIVENAGRRFNLADPTTWPEQAALAAKEAWDELEKLQDRLKGGRR